MAVGALLALCLSAFPGAEGRAAESRYMPGFASLGTTVPETGERLDIAVWYPVPATRRGVGSLQIDGWTFEGGRNYKPAPGSFPLLIISHDSAGSRLSNHDLATFLSEQGFAVAVPTHPGDNAHSTSHMFLPEQITARPEHIRLTVDTVLASERFPDGFIDAGRIGIIGVGTGATAALLLAGAVPDGDGVVGYCAMAAEDDPYCTQWAQERLRRMPSAFIPNQAPRPDARVRAAALLAPGYGMLFPRHSLTEVLVPIFIASGSEDRIAPAALHAAFIRGNLPDKPEELPLRADHEAFSAPCPAAVGRELPSLCTRLTPKEHRAMRQELFAKLAAFFHRTLGISPA